MALLDGSSTVALPLIGDLATGYALIEATNRSIGGILADVTVREVHSDESVITAFPVETGTPASDHVFRAPAVLEISCGWSDSNGGPGYVQAIYQQLLVLRDTRQPFTISTGKRLYENMLFGNINVVTDELSELALMVTARFQEVIISNTTDVSGNGMTAANQRNPASTAPETNMGQQSLQTYPGLSGFSTNGSVATAGTTIGPGVSSAQTLGNAGGGLSFDSYMAGFS